MALAFLELGTEKVNLSQDASEKLEQFVMFMYEKNSAVTTVNAARQKLFPQRCKAINTYVSPQSTKIAISIRLGMDQRQPRKPLWTTLRQAEDSYYEPIHCGFKQDCKTRCKCAAANLPCTALCYFGGDCKAEQLDDSIRIFQCVNCCSFISVHVMNLLSPAGTLD